MDQTSIHVARAIRGERESIEWVVCHFQPLVEAQVRLRLGRHARPEDVEDLVAELWLVTLRRLPEIESRDGRSAPVLVKFLGTTALQLCNNFLRKRIRRGIAPDSRPRPDPSSQGRTLDRLARQSLGVVTRLEHAETRDAIQRCLARLTPEKRDVLVLRFMEQRSNQDIAAILRIQANTVAARYRRALEDIRQCLPEAVFAELWEARK